MTPRFLSGFRRLALVLPLIAWSWATAAEPARTVILVRHAERAGGMSADVEISEAGRLRAEALARILSDAGITAIYTSDAKRTQQTAAPLAQKTGIRPKVVPANDTGKLVAQLRADASGGTVLVVGHSNTVPDIASRLSGGTVKAMGDGEYDRLTLVTLPGSGKASVVTLRYPACSK
jgi:broad specificity phosphatase PhoE